MKCYKMKIIHSGQYMTSTALKSFNSIHDAVDVAAGLYWKDCIACIIEDEYGHVLFDSDSDSPRKLISLIENKDRQVQEYEPRKISYDEFLKRAQKTVRDYVQDKLLKSGEDVSFEVFVMRSCFIVQNMKAMIATTVDDDLYYEVTCNQGFGSMHMDVFRKCDSMKTGL